MKESKKQLEKAIVILAESLNMKEATELLLIKVGIHSTVKELTYKMFVENRQQYFEKDDKVFEAISLIRKYCQEMSKNGEVNFDVPYVYGA
jgi:uncharacterized protein YpmS